VEARGPAGSAAWQQALSFIITMVALFLEPSWKAWLPAAADDAVRGTIFAGLFFYCVEISLMWHGERGYANTIFFAGHSRHVELDL
jgi:hypothetical protein